MQVRPRARGHTYSNILSKFAALVRCSATTVHLHHAGEDVQSGRCTFGPCQSRIPRHLHDPRACQCVSASIDAADIVDVDDA